MRHTAFILAKCREYSVRRCIAPPEPDLVPFYAGIFLEQPIHEQMIGFNEATAFLCKAAYLFILKSVLFTPFNCDLFQSFITVPIPILFYFKFLDTFLKPSESTAALNQVIHNVAQPLVIY